MLNFLFGEMFGMLLTNQLFWKVMLVWGFVAYVAHLGN